MASFNIHLVIGKRYIEKSGLIKNELEFYKGVIAPDLKQNKKESHYTGYQDKSNLLEYLSKKVQLNEFLKIESINSDYQKGVFLHLITDYLFFNQFFHYHYLQNISYQNFFEDLYYSYDITNKYLENKYDIDYMEFATQIENNINKRRVPQHLNKKQINILPFNKLDTFIEFVSSIDLENYKNKILKNEKNVLP